MVFYDALIIVVNY